MKTGRLSAKMLLNVLAIILAASFSTIILSQGYIHISYDYQMPAVPQPGTGRIHSITVNHGDVRYVTQEEFARAHFVLDTLFWWEYPLFAALGVLVVYGRVFQR
jgi:hypothetical protein